MQVLKRFCLMLSFLFLALSSVYSSPKDTILEKLIDYQSSLALVKTSIQSYEQITKDLELKTSDLQKQLEDSKNSSQTIIDELKASLEESRQLLVRSQQDLTTQQEIYNQLSTECQRLQTLLGFYRNGFYIGLAGVGTALVYVVGHLAGIFP